MQEAWLQLQCPACEEDWEEKVADLSGPESSFECDSCGETRPLSEFMQTSRDLEVLREFHA
ncbi:hypothetical protein KTS45_02090 [Halomicroarcula limicola]|uniref:DUF7836 domain-containing protein n=1 Tax=Haloarcula limicola TaxID=1429915 RepID=A0A8J8C2E3_9EURY|nr:hypothetical protein [Halomicroarcula limicola]MBV0922977.1 hypothetical protein [Halomicroarcula limicola]